MSLRMLHPPRTGGSSVVRAWKLGAPEYKAHKLPERDSKWSYGFTRNPWDRVVSLYHLAHVDKPPQDGFDDWVLSGMPANGSPGTRIFDSRTRLPAWEWNKYAHFIVRFEHREADLAVLAHLLGRKAPELHVNKIERKADDYRSYYKSNAAIETVGLMYVDDATNHGYTF